LLVFILALALAATPAFGQAATDQDSQPGAASSGQGQGHSGAYQAPGTAMPGQPGMQQGAVSPGPNIPERALGKPGFVLSGKVREVKPDQGWLIISTDRGSQMVSVTPQSLIRNPENKDIKLQDISEGNRVVVSFRREGGLNVLDSLYQVSD
jgi:hypothetical protein